MQKAYKMGILSFYENSEHDVTFVYVAEGRRGITIACCESLNKMDCKTCHEIVGKKL